MLLVVDLGLLALLAVYGLHRAHLVLVYLRKRDAAPPRRLASSPLPLVTVQIPMYNEPRVAARILEEVAALDHPRDRLQIQALDDSTDETSQIVAAKVRDLQQRGFDAVHLHRTARSGFKAGALAHGLPTAKGELILILDADYRPDPGLLRETIGYFDDPEVGMVQARHEHLNRGESWLTRVEATLLDGHFVIEQIARNRSGCFSTFHGTGGVWRKTAIVDAGGWDGDVLAEDTDISFRAQLRGWRFHYVTEPLAPSELPHDMPSFVAQQHRWVKGIAQTARKVLPALVHSKVPWRVKVEGVFHLTGVFTYVPVAILAALQLPTVLAFSGHEVRAATTLDGWLFAASLTPILVFYSTARRATGGGALETLLVLPALLAVGVGVSLANARAALEGVVGHRSEFVRTPKWGTGVLAPRAQLGGVLELMFGLYSLATLVVALQSGAWLGLAFHGLFAWGFLWVGVARLALFDPLRCERSMPRTDFDLICVGGGPAGTGPLVAAARQGLFGEWRVAVVEKSDQLCAGALGHYELESISRAATFLEALQGGWCARAAQSDAAEALRAYGDRCAPLSVVARFLAELGRDLCDVVSVDGRVFTGTEALSVQSRSPGFAVRVRNSEGELVLTARRLVLALGGAPRPLPSATITADSVLRGQHSERVQHAVVIGGAHSAFASARMLLQTARTVTLVLRSRLRLFADSESAARLDGIAVEPEDVCPRTGRVHRFGGLRFRERELALAVLAGREPRVTLLQAQDPRVAEHLARADQVINATGYEAREIRVVGPYDGIVRMGLGSGFHPPRAFGGEASYRGPIDGVWLYQHPLGESVLREVTR